MNWHTVTSPIFAADAGQAIRAKAQLLLRLRNGSPITLKCLLLLLAVAGECVVLAMEHYRMSSEKALKKTLPRLVIVAWLTLLVRVAGVGQYNGKTSFLNG